MSLNIVDHPEKDYIEIEGIKYHYSFFQIFGINGPQVGTVVRIDRREDGVIIVTKLREGPSQEISFPEEVDPEFYLSRKEGERQS